MNKKGYISKSNHVHMDDLLKIRTLLKDNEIKTLEFSGGNYDENLIKKADLVICIPARSAVEDKYIALGRGIGGEVIGAVKRKQSVYIYNPDKDTFHKPVQIIKSTADDWKYDFYRCTEWKDVDVLDVFKESQNEKEDDFGLLP